jgi:hypothetical protein
MAAPVTIELAFQRAARIAAIADWLRTDGATELPAGLIEEFRENDELEGHQRFYASVSEAIWDDVLGRAQHYRVRPQHAKFLGFGPEELYMHLFNEWLHVHHQFAPQIASVREFHEALKNALLQNHLGPDVHVQMVRDDVGVAPWIVIPSPAIARAQMGELPPGRGGGGGSLGAALAATAEQGVLPSEDSNFSLQEALEQIGGVHDALEDSVARARAERIQSDSESNAGDSYGENSVEPDELERSPLAARRFRGARAFVVSEAAAAREDRRSAKRARIDDEQNFGLAEPRDPTEEVEGEANEERERVVFKRL